MEENMINVSETEKYLPIGTVVLLKGATKRLMIAGYCAVDQEKKDEMWDYSGCMYPEGFLSSSQSFLFDHSQIAKIYSLGYKDNEEEEFQQKLVSYINSKGSGEDGTDDSEGSEGTTPVSNETVTESSESVEEVEEVSTPVEEAPVSAEPVAPASAEVVEPASSPVAETPAATVEQPVVNSGESNSNVESSNSADTENPNNAADLSEFDQWLNQTGPYANNDGNNANQ